MLWPDYQEFILSFYGCFQNCTDKVGQYAHDIGSGSALELYGRFAVYTASSRALACLENVVHRSGRGLQGDFRTMVINIPDELPTETISVVELPDNWSAFDQYSGCQHRGDGWLAASETVILRVPSAIVPFEHNYLLNPQHPDFRLIKLIAVEPFTFTAGLKARRYNAHKYRQNAHSFRRFKYVKSRSWA